MSPFARYAALAGLMLCTAGSARAQETIPPRPPTPAAPARTPAPAATADDTTPAQPPQVNPLEPSAPSDLDPDPAAATPTVTPPTPPGTPVPPAPNMDDRFREPPGPLGPPQPYVPDITQRSGLISRFTPVPVCLPPDRKRDTFYRTRFDDWYHPYRNTRNCYKDGGLYGRPWPGTDTAAVSPFFRGSPGASTITPCSEPQSKYGRILGNYFHPFRPVGMYYDRGVYTPIYDLDPMVPGPGPFPWNHYLRQCTGG